MKKQLLAGTAIVAAAMLVAGGAMAQDKKMAAKKMMKPSISVGGYWDQHVGMVLDEDSDLADTTALDVRNDSEIYFKGSAMLDSGVKISTFTQLEGSGVPKDTTSDPIDEYGITISGSFGQITMGGTENAPTRMVTRFTGSWATGVGETLNFDSDDWVGSVAPKAFGTIQHSRLSSGDGEKIIYITPKFEGFQIGASYQPRGTNDDDINRVDAEADAHDGLAGAITYAGKFGDVGLGAGVGVMSMQGSNDGVKDDSNGWVVGGSLNFGAATIAAGYKRTSDPVAARGHITDLGVRYVVGANSFSVTGSHGEMEDSEVAYSAVMGSYARALGPGVKIHVNLIWNESQDGTADATGLAGVTSIKVAF